MKPEMIGLWFWSLNLRFKAIVTVELMRDKVLLWKKDHGKGLVLTSEC